MIRRQDLSNHHNKANDISLAPYYGITIIATTIGLCLVVILNMVTPLSVIQERLFAVDGSLDLLAVGKFFLPRFLTVLSGAYLCSVISLYQLLKPISICLKMMRMKISPGRHVLLDAQKRLINLHLLFVPVNVFMWIIIPGLLCISFIAAGVTDEKTIVSMSARASMVGLIVSAIASQRIEAISKQHLIPFFFPDGQLSRVVGVNKISISKKIGLVNRLSAITPIVILLVTLITLQWNLENRMVSAQVYGQGIVLFTVVILVWTLVFSKQLTMLLTRNIVEPVNDLVETLKSVQKGDFEHKTKVVSNDEVGYAGEVVNEMLLGLKEKKMMQDDLNLAREVQQNLLPSKNIRKKGIDLSGTTIYCDETGGDFYDFLGSNDKGKEIIRIAIGDVSGHGIPSALLMATSIALLRQRSLMEGTLADVVTDMNQQVCKIVGNSGNFITLFCMEIDLSEKYLKWVRAGHEPGMIYNAEMDQFTELKGKGIALGIDEAWQYEQNEIHGITKEMITFVFTDGIPESLDEDGGHFGKTRMKDLIRKNRDMESRIIVDSVLKRLDRFRGKKKAMDDASLIVFKM